ncbi:MAG: hypothetical protein JXP73_15510 [Deltaproteobacteria bacterium]|nr:hypothetical protein [Deltaproteobacteria bacterium]
MRLALLPFLLLCVGGCRPREASTPTEAHARLVAALAAHDGTLLWDALDQDTRWSWMTIQRAWRECYDITHSVVPEGPERTRLLARFEPGATSENAKALFARMLSTEDWTRAKALVTAAGSRLPELRLPGESSEIATPVGPLVYRKGRGRSAGWGYAGLAGLADQLKFAASADLERMRRDAADYERAATRGAR